MLNVIDDVKKIVSGPHNICPLNFMLSALSDIVQLLKTAHTTVHTGMLTFISIGLYKY